MVRGQVPRDDHASVEPAELEGHAVLRFQQRVLDGLGLVGGIGVGVPATDRRRELGEREIGLA